MLQNIREIGIFMIVAQAVVHFAPGRQYERYIKSISGVIILLLFLKPFVQMAGGQWQMPSGFPDGSEGIAETLDFSDSFPYQETGVENEVKKRMEEEITARLNRELEGEPCFVKQVCLIWTEGSESSGNVPFWRVDILIGEREADDGRIVVDEITVENECGGAAEEPESYRRRFAGLLGMEEERVEVRWDGRD